MLGLGREFRSPFRMFMEADTGGAEVNEDNYLGTDEEGNSYYADDDGNITMIDSSGNEVHSSVDADRGETTDLGGYTYDTDTESDYTFDDNGNLVNASTGQMADTSNWGNVIRVSGADGSTVAGYTYDEKTGKYKSSSGKSYTNETLNKQLHALGGDAGAKVADNIALSLGNLLNDKNTAAIADQLGSGSDTLRQALADNADAIKSGKTNTGMPVMIGILTGTLPVNTTQKEADTVGKILDRLENGESLKDAFYTEMDAAGYTANAAMNRALVEVALQAALTYGTLGLGVAAGTLANSSRWGGSAASQVIRNVLNATGLGSKIGTGARGQATINGVIAVANNLEKGAAIVSIASQLGISVKEATDVYNTIKEVEAGGGNYYDNLGASNLENYNSRQEAEASEESKMAASTPVTSTPPVESRPTEEKTPDSTPSDGLTFNPSNPTITLPTGGIDWLEVEKNKPKEEEKTTAVDRGFSDESSDDSGSDTLETTTPPSSGVGTDTYSNPNVEAGKKGWGLGEEDPNRANYDNDKWNRGMERVSTNVVSDAKVKDFITKTFKHDPVLIKTVKIMKTK